ncbi:hypothetical protein H0Z60_17010 [Ectothiorhodospiraceae bacterium WFHF3C12]|nr:hypothetical protein [Ectothiorhodospiraceae bacterium WFHF3C12]
MEHRRQGRPQTDEETKREKLVLAQNAWHLARFAVEHNNQIQLPEDFDAGTFLKRAEDYPNLPDKDKIHFVNEYARLEKVTGNVTARTLSATRIHGRGFMHAAFRTSVGQYLVFLGLLTLLFTALLFLNRLDWIYSPDHVAPFAAAGLGTCIFLLRVTQKCLTRREFDPAYIPSQLIRLVLGILAGGSIVLLPGLRDYLGGAADAAGTGAAAGQLLLAFILGYAVDVFYSILDNIGGKVEDLRSFERRQQ